MADRRAHAARTVVLLPYAQLMPVAARLWAQRHPDGFAPRFETTRNWARQLAVHVPAAHDLSFDMARDRLTAQSLLEQAGLGAKGEGLAGPLLALASQLAALAAAQPPAQREAWATELRPVVAAGGESGVLALETAMARIALAWAAASGYATDVLFERRVDEALDCLIVLQGFQSEPLTDALLQRVGDKGLALPLPAEAARGRVRLHAAAEAEDEAQRAAACVLRHLEAGRTPVALVATDRALTRRIRAMLDAQRIVVRDENGWTLSTTRAAAQLMSNLRACAWDASGDAVLEWLKCATAVDAAALRRLETELRKKGARQWRAPQVARDDEALAALLAQVAAWREGLKQARPLAHWLAALRALLQATGQWDALGADAAGAQMLAELRLHEGAPQELEALNAGGRRITLADFTAWVREVLEAARYVPAYPLGEQVVVLPLSQLLGRPFGALVLPGCDERRLAPSPEPPGPWTSAQRAMLGLPSREDLAAAQRAAWTYALQTPECDVLWREGDEGGEPLLPSPLVQALRLDEAAACAEDPRLRRALVPAPLARPEPTGQALPVSRLSASAYGDLRQCPYRFFALRQLGLAEAGELETELDKRDFGNWLHAVLRQFHEMLQAHPQPQAPARAALLDRAAGEVTRSQGLDEGEFLPFAAVWPRVRDGYLAWLAADEAQGARFAQAEVWKETPLGGLTLIGQIDRIDRLPDGSARLIDYKTESPAVTGERIRSATEDTQLAFYAALMQEEALSAAYLNVGERDGTKRFEQPEVGALRDLLLAGITDELGRIASGAPLPALGEGAVCERCAARGLCRKDFWS